MKHPLSRLSFFAAALCATTLVTGLRAQTVPAAPAKNSGEVIALSEFQVSEKASNGYIASETMTGSRVNTKIVDLPYSIVNLTSEFFKDFNIDILDENMTYIGGLTGIGIGGGFNLRGVSATSQMKDGFYRLGRYGLSNIDRVEIIRGPNAAIYGRSSPGGMINFVSLQPKKQDVQEVRLSTGRYDQNKSELYLTGSIGDTGKTYYVVDLAQRSRGFPGNSFSHVRNNEGFVAIQHDFEDNSHLKFSAEYFLQIQHSPQSGAPIVSVARTATPDNAAVATVVGYDMALAGINPFGPNSELNRGSETFTGTYDKKFTNVWSTRVGAYRFAARRWDYNQNNGWPAFTIPAAGGPVTVTRGPLPSRGEIMEDGGGFQADLVAHYFFADNKVENKTLFTVDLNDYYRWDPTWEFSANTDPTLVAWAAAGSPRPVTLTPTLVNGRTDYAPSAAVGYFPVWYTASNLALFAPPGNDITGGTSLNGGTLTRRRTTSLGGNIRQQMLLLDGRLIAYAGLRLDNVKFSQRDYTVQFASVGFNLPAGQGGVGQPGSSVVRRYVHQKKPNAGFNFKVTPNLHVYGSYSEAYFVDQTSRPAVIAATTYAPFTSKGLDYGFKGSYFEQKLNFTLGGYYTRQYNVLVTDAVETPPGSGTFVNVSRQDGDQLIRGWEADVSWVLAENLTAGGSFGRVDSKYTFFGSSVPQAVGRSVNGITPENGSAYLKYNFSNGPLKGLSLNALVAYVSSTPTQNPTTGDTLTRVGGQLVVTAHTDGWKLRLPSTTLWTFGLHYRLPRLNNQWDQSLGLNLNNAFDKYYLKTNATLGDRRSIMFSYTLTHSRSHH